jgi:hypothetical protein
MRSLILILHQDKVRPHQNDSVELTTWSSSLLDQNSETLDRLNQNVVVFGHMLCSRIMLSSAHEINLLIFPGSNMYFYILGRPLVCKYPRILDLKLAE